MFKSDVDMFPHRPDDDRRGTMPLKKSSDIVRCRQKAKRLAERIGLSVIETTKLVTAASELGRNTFTYGGGEMRWELVNEGRRRGVRLAFEDRGPGIADIELALVDGWTSGRGMGLGLSGSRRLVQDFDLRTEIGVGTCVMIASWR